MAKQRTQHFVEGYNYVHDTFGHFVHIGELVCATQTVWRTRDGSAPVQRAVRDAVHTAGPPGMMDGPS